MQISSRYYRAAGMGLLIIHHDLYLTEKHDTAFHTKYQLTLGTSHKLSQLFLVASNTN